MADHSTPARAGRNDIKEKALVRVMLLAKEKGIRRAKPTVKATDAPLARSDRLLTVRGGATGKGGDTGKRRRGGN